MDRRRTVLLGATLLWIQGIISMPVGATGGNTDPNRPAGRPVVKLTKGILRQAVDKAKSNDPNELRLFHQLIEDISGGRWVPSMDLLPDLKAYLKDPDQRIQLLAVSGLRRLKDKDSVKNLVAYVNATNPRDLARRESASKDQIESHKLFFGLIAYVQAIETLGDIGDRSVISDLISMRSMKIGPIGNGPAPVEYALSRLGPEGIRTLASLGPKADRDQVSAAAYAMNGIRDPNVTAVLVEIVKDSQVATDIRAAAVNAMGYMPNIEQSLPFLLATMRQMEYPQYVRTSAALAALRSKDPGVEKALLDLIDRSDSDMRVECLQGLTYKDPNRYLPVELKIILDKSAPIDERKGLAQRIKFLKGEQIRPHLDLIRQGLQATEKDGRPADSIRMEIWLVLNNTTGEKPTLELLDPRKAFSQFRSYFEQRVMAQNHYAGPSETEAILEREVKSFVVQWQPGKAGEKP